MFHHCLHVRQWKPRTVWWVARDVFQEYAYELVGFCHYLYEAANTFHTKYEMVNYNKNHKQIGQQTAQILCMCGMQMYMTTCECS